MTVFRLRPLDAIAADGDRLDETAALHHAHSLGPARIDLPPLPIGATFLERWAIREHPGEIDWRATHYDSAAPALFVLRDALLHSTAGIIGLGGDVVAETLAHADPERHGFIRLGDRICLADRPIRRLAGTHVTLLAGGTANYFHAMIDGVMRLAMVPPERLQAAQGVLHAAQGVGQAEMLSLMGLKPHLRITPVEDDEAVRVDRLIYPMNLHGLSRYHPCLMAQFDRIAARVPEGDTPFPNRFYLARGASASRPLANEDAVAEALRPLGFVAVRPERLSVADQVRLFRGANKIVAPHGAGLTNLGFCRPGCAVLELQMDSYVNWCFRHLAAVRGLAYDCVLGRAAGVGWSISTQHVAAAAEAVLF